MRSAIVRCAVLVCAFAAISPAQTIIRNQSEMFRKYDATCSGTASASAPNCVIHLPSTVTNVALYLNKVVITVPEDTTATFTWGGDAPSGGTLITPRKQNTSTASVVVVRQETTSANGTAKPALEVLTGISGNVFDVTDEKFLPGPLSNRTLKVTLGTITGDWTISITYMEGF